MAPRLAWGPLSVPFSSHRASAGGGVDLVADVAERVAGVGAQRADRRDADHDDQGQHHRVLDGGRAVFTLEEVHQGGLELAHGRVLSFVPESLSLPVLCLLRPRWRADHEAAAVLSDTLLKVLLALEPSELMAAMQTTMMRASITAYSTAVGPSSLLRKVRTLASQFFISQSPL